MYERLEAFYPQDTMPFGPFSSRKEWKLGAWCVRNIGHGETDDLLGGRGGGWGGGFEIGSLKKKEGEREGKHTRSLRR